MRLATATLVARDYGSAIAFFTGALGFRLIEDRPLGGGKRWVVVEPSGGGARLLIARAADAAQTARAGDQTGGRVAFFLETDDLDRARACFEARGVRFEGPSRDEAYGRVAVFRDGEGNRWDLIEPVNGPPPARVVSIQSQVVHGHVGNGAALPALAACGITAAGVPTTLLSNHPRYPTLRGRALDPEEVAALLQGVEERGLVSGPAIVLSGYLGAAGTGAAIEAFVARARRSSAALRHLCDPVAGDAGPGFFVSEPVRDAIAALAARADVLTPNQFELGWLAGRSVATRAEAVAAARALGRPAVAVTGCAFGADALETLWVEPEGAWSVVTPRLPIRAHGTGDLFAALLAARLARGEAGADAAAAAVSGVMAALRATPPEADEMALIPALGAVASPPERFAATAV